VVGFDEHNTPPRADIRMEFFMAAQRPHQAVQSASGRRRRNALRQEYEIGVRMLAPQRLQWPIDKLMGSAGEGPGSRSAASKDLPGLTPMAGLLCDGGLHGAGARSLLR
jgi:hypothetical protein